MTPYSILLHASGLLAREAAVLHGVDISSVRNWASERRRVPPEFVLQLHDLVRSQRAGAADGLCASAAAEGAAIEIEFPANDREAQSMGWPSASAWRGMAGRFLAGLDSERLFRVEFARRVSPTPAGEDYTDYGTVEGRLQVVSERGGRRAEITDPLNDKPIRCLLDRESMKTALALLGRRVEAYGAIRYGNDGNIVSIAVEKLTPFPTPENLPSSDDVRGILGSTKP